MSSTKRITKTDKIDAIKHHFYEMGKRMTNLTKATIDKLDTIILNYNINVEAYLIYKKEMEEEAKIKNQEQEAKRLIEEEKQEEMNLKLKQKLKQNWELLTDEQREYCYIRDYDMHNNYDKITKHNNKLIRQTDSMERKFIADGRRVERRSDNELMVNGIMVCNGYLECIADKTEWINSRKEEDQQKLVYYDEDIIPLINQFIQNNKPKKTKKMKKIKLVIVEEEEAHCEECTELITEDDRDIETESLELNIIRRQEQSN
jgi:hypothetical protein